jgi:hypothetical protein
VAAHQCRPIKIFERMGLQGHLYPGHTHWLGGGWPKHIIFAPDSEIPPFSFRTQTLTFDYIHAEWTLASIAVPPVLCEEHRSQFDAISVGLGLLDLVRKQVPLGIGIRLVFEPA